MTDRIRRRGGVHCAAMVMAVLLASALAPPDALAHITRAEVQFSDIASSDARFDIGFLAALGIIPKAPMFEPGKPLTRKDLAIWAALSKSKADHDKKSALDALAKEALATGQVDSLDGVATFADLARAFFKDAVLSDRAGDIPTRAEAARFVASRGETLLAVMGYKMGPTGAIGKVEQKVNEAGGTAFFIAIDQTTLPMYAHGSVSAGPADLSKWVGRPIGRTVIRTENGREMWSYLEAAGSF